MAPAVGAVRNFARDELFTYQMVGGIVPERRDGRHHSPSQSEGSAVLALLTAIVIAMIVFGGFYLFAQWKSSTGVTTTPHSQPVAP